MQITREPPILTEDTEIKDGMTVLIPFENKLLPHKLEVSGNSICMHDDW